jgi:hypothetical protein
MGEDFLIDYMTGMALSITAYFVAYGFAAMFRAFKLPADAS